MTDHRAKHNEHPLLRLFHSKRIFWRDGMNLLQEGPLRFISDECVTPEEVHPDDVAAVMNHAEKIRKQKTNP